MIADFSMDKPFGNGVADMAGEMRKTILLVEDEGLIAINEASSLENGGYDVISAMSGAEAIRKVSEHPEIDLVLMDIDLGKGIDGTEAARRILEERDIPILFLSSHTEPKIVEKTEAITSYGYVVKNSGETVLLASIRMAFRLFEAYRREREKEIALAAGEQAYREIFDSTNEAIFIDDAATGRILDVNDGMLRMYGYDTKEEVLAGNIGDLSANRHPFTEEVAQSRVRAAIDEGPQIFEWLAKRKDGSFFPAEVSLRETRIGGEGRVLAVVRNITGRKRAEEALHETTSILQLFIENNPNYVFIKDANIRPLYLSRNYETMLHRPLEEILGKTMDELFPSDLAKSMIADDKRTLSEGEPLEVVEELEGRTFWTLKFPLRIDGVPKYLAGYTIDITQQRQTEAALRKALEEKETLLRELQHRVMNSLVMIGSLVSLEQARTEHADTRKTLENLQRRVDSLAKLYTLLYKTGDVDHVSLKEYLERVVASLSRAYAGDRIRLHTDFAPIFISGKNAAPFGLLVNELVMNAFKHAFPDLRTGSIDVSLKQNDTGIRLSVTDDGIGPNADFSLQQTTGFGIRLVLLLTKQLGGKLSFERGEKNVFILQIPGTPK